MCEGDEGDLYKVMPLSQLLIHVLKKRKEAPAAAGGWGWGEDVFRWKYFFPIIPPVSCGSWPSAQMLIPSGAPSCTANLSARVRAVDTDMLQFTVRDLFRINMSQVAFNPS